MLITISGIDPRLLAADERSDVVHHGWTPQLAPNILTNPASQSIAGGGTATFTVAAAGIFDPTYQWLKNGTNLNGQTGTTLTINNASVNDAGSYSVIVSNPAGVVTSTVATLSVGNSAPVFITPPTGTNIAINVGVNLSVACTATDSDTPAQTLTYSLLSGPTWCGG